MSIESIGENTETTLAIEDLRSECKTNETNDLFLQKNLREIDALISFKAYETANSILENNLRESYEHLGIFHVYNALLCSILESPEEGLNSCGIALKELSDINLSTSLRTTTDSIPHGYIFLVEAALNLQNKSSGSALHSINKALELNNLPEFIAFRALIYYSRAELDKAYKDAEEALEKGLRLPLLGVDLTRLYYELHGLKAFVESERGLDFSENWHKGECSNLFKYVEGKIVNNKHSSEGLTNLLLCKDKIEGKIVHNKLYI